MSATWLHLKNGNLQNWIEHIKQRVTVVLRLLKELSKTPWATLVIKNVKGIGPWEGQL